MSTKAPADVAAFLAKLPPERQDAITRVREVILKNLPKGYEEHVRGGVIAYEVPLAVYPDTYNKQPLWLAAIGAHKTTISLYLMPVYGSPVLLKRLTDGFREAGKKLDMGKSCIHFKQSDDLELDVIGEIIAAMPMRKWIDIAKSARKR